METETQNNTQDRPEPRLHRAAQWMEQMGELAALTIYWNPANAATHRLSQADLQSIVQQAYDMFGMVAEPRVTVEAQRHDPRTPAEVIVDEQDGWTTDTLELLQQRMARA